MGDQLFQRNPDKIVYIGRGHIHILSRLPDLVSHAVGDPDFTAAVRPAHIDPGDRTALVGRSEIRRSDKFDRNAVTLLLRHDRRVLVILPDRPSLICGSLLRRALRQNTINPCPLHPCLSSGQ